jgi:hypothetical protein
MIRQLANKGEPENRPQNYPDEITLDPAEMPESPVAVLDEGIDAADFFDPEDLGVQTRR